MATSYTLGVEIGGTKQQISLASPEGKIIKVLQGRAARAEGAEGIKNWLLTEIPPFLQQARQNQKTIERIGIGFGGPVDSSTGAVLKSVQIRGWSGFPLKSWFEKNFDLPTLVANDTNAAAWGEYCRGSGRGTKQFFYTNLGSGVGGGLVLDRRLYDGQGYGAGEFGQTYVPDWTSSEPGKAEKIENLCSGWSIENRLRSPGYVPESSALYRDASADINQLNARMLADAARAGDSFALREIDRVAYSMGLGLANVLCLFNPEVLAVGGGVSKMGEILLDPIRKYTRQYEFISSVDNYQIVGCELGESIVLVGAVLLANQNLF